MHSIDLFEARDYIIWKDAVEVGVGVERSFTVKISWVNVI
jgi:hypothetical protein